ncbi:PREDICTED: uncharacterized protein LOC108374853 [Rhagoletis zephyria]|uniref:uncharacterized protein LOC108374853 n=1 Tax=Rhagoletis zephyria TaxID=28612 RepID=UPI00081171C9|nr:PREDICTED: uncharacterized protein LOC108374853 [Rhagoletis zephyria]
MASTVTDEDEESLRKQCENASLEDAPQSAKKQDEKAILPPIKVTMSFNDWKQMKDAAEDRKTSITPMGRNPIGPKWHNQRNTNGSLENLQQNQNNNKLFFRSQQQNFPNFNAFSQRQNQRSGRNFFQDAMIPPIMPPLAQPQSFDEFFQQEQWSSGPLMQPMFPPMPRMPRLNPQGLRINQSGHFNSRLSSQKRPSTRVKPRSGHSNTTTTDKVSHKEHLSKILKTPITSEKNTIPSQEDKMNPQIYIQRPRNISNKNDKPKSNWILKPQAPPPMQAITPESREEKQRLWREYRQAMKPFKNREFANAKRVVQRLGKKKYEELDEKERERFDRAYEAVNAHKDMLNARVSQRSARVEQQIKYVKNGISSGSTESAVQPNKSSGWNASTYRGIGNTSYTQNDNPSLRPATIMGGFVSGGIWNPTADLAQTKS